MTLLYERQLEPPVTHVFVVGCGRYPFLATDHAADRRAPVAGALALAKVLLDNRDRLVAPLGSLEMLLSDPEVNAGPTDIGQALGAEIEQTIDPANEQNFRDCGENWISRIRPGDAVVFYFSGHGIVDRQGGAVGLLEDIRSKQNHPWRQSFGALNLIQALQTVGADSVWVFFDGCQEVVAEFAERLWEVKNIDLKEVSLADITGEVCEPLALAGARIGQLAWAPTNGEPPFFTQVLIKGLSGCCVERTNTHGWAVTGRTLLFGLRQLGETMFEEVVVRTQPIFPYSEHKALVAIDQPFMHLTVRSDPEVHLSHAASIRVMHGDVELYSSAIAQYVWRVDVALEERDLTIQCVSQAGAVELAPQTFRQQAPSHIITLVPVGAPV